MENKRNQLKPGDTIRCIKTFWNSETQTQVEEGYIVRNMTQFGIDCLSHPECWEKVNSTREKALAWWDSLDSAFKVKYCFEYNKSKQLPLNRKWSDLTGREIEEIWRKETKQVGFIGGESLATSVGLQPNQKQYSQEEVDRLLDQQAARTTSQVLTSNQKQFKQFDESLHKAYLNKFSEEDKFKAFISNLNELSEEIQFNAFLATLKKMKLDSQTQSNIMTLVALKDI